MLPLIWETTIANNSRRSKHIAVLLLLLLFLLLVINITLRDDENTMCFELNFDRFQYSISR